MIRNVIYIPAIYSSFLVKLSDHYAVIFYNETRKLKIPLNFNKFEWSFDCENNSVITIKNMINNNWSLYVNKVNHTIYTFEGMFFQKINFKGKGFKLRTKRIKKFIIFMFGHSHRNNMFIGKTQMKRLTKYKYFLKSKFKYKLRLTATKLCSVRPLNIYTKRGLRKTKQIVFKRKGKKSTYI